MLRRIMIFLTSILLLLNSASVNATTINGWFLSNPNAVGASILYDATKGPLTSSILISPNASQVAKVLRGGVAGIALTLAVKQLLGAVDWVLDPANNQIVYSEPTDPAKPPNTQYYYRHFTSNPSFTFYGSTIQQLANNFCSKRLSFSSVKDCLITSVTESTFHVVTTCKVYEDCYGLEATFTPQRILNPNFNPEVETEQKKLPLITVAQQVIENAESDNLDAQFAVLAAATNILSEAEQDDAIAKPIADELENNFKCPSGIVRNGSCWICDKSLFMPYTRATRDAKTATRGKSCKNITDTTIKASNAVLFRNLINARVQENACWSPPDQNHATALVDAQNALSLCEN